MKYLIYLNLLASISCLSVIFFTKQSTDNIIILSILAIVNLGFFLIVKQKQKKT